MSAGRVADDFASDQTSWRAALCTGKSPSPPLDHGLRGEPFPNKRRMACLRPFRSRVVFPPLVVPPVETGCNRRAREGRTAVSSIIAHSREGSDAGNAIVVLGACWSRRCRVHGAGRRPGSRRRAMTPRSGGTTPARFCSAHQEKTQSPSLTSRIAKTRKSSPISSWIIQSSAPPTNLAVHPSGDIALVANSVTQTKDGENWKPVPDNKVYVIDLEVKPASTDCDCGSG